MAEPGLVAAVLLLWQAVASAGLVAPDFLPPPTTVLATLADILRNGYRETTLAGDAGATLGRCLAGFLLAVVTGRAARAGHGALPAGCRRFGYVVQFMRPLPPLSYLILLILWLGTGDRSKIALLYLTAFPIIVTPPPWPARAASRPSGSRPRRR
ncbi:MAG: hypothetical protein WDN49_03130 [Acetobacteraceae bacterium]